VFFCAGRGSKGFAGEHNWDIRGHVLDDKGLVRETFAFGTFATALEPLRQHWEFFRRYMEEGPQALPALDRMLPIANRREGFVFGLRRMWLNTAGFLPLFIILLPVTTLAGIARFFCMQTSRIPRWPSEMDGENLLGPDDPFLCEANPDGSVRRAAAGKR
jgi:hypothetical protein